MEDVPASTPSEPVSGSRPVPAPERLSPARLPFAATAFREGHDLIGAERFLGWDHQLRDEPVLQLLHERRRRWHRRESPAGWG